MNLPPSGWYPDPEQSGMLRYWDGVAWSEHRSVDSLPAGLRPIGDWLSITFATLWRNTGVLLLLAVVLVVVPSVPLALALDAWLRDLVVIDGDASGFNHSALPAVVAAGVFSLLASLLFTAAAAHTLVWAQRGHQSSPGVVLRAALRALPRLVGATLAVTVPLAVLLAAISFVGVAGLVALGILLWLALVFVVGVRAAFVAMAAAVAPHDIGVLRASAEVSAGRFWSIVGRLVLLALVTVGVTLAANLLTSPATALLGGFDPNDVEIADDGTVDRLVMDELLPGPAALPVSLAISALIQAVAIGVWIAGLAVIYLDVRAPLRGGP